MQVLVTQEGADFWADFGDDVDYYLCPERVRDEADAKRARAWFLKEIAANDWNIKWA